MYLVLANNSACTHVIRRVAFCLRPQVSIFVSGPGTTRLLNVHPDCILAVFPADTPLPTPSRLEWLTNCGKFEAYVSSIIRPCHRHTCGELW